MLNNMRKNNNKNKKTSSVAIQYFGKWKFQKHLSTVDQMDVRTHVSESILPWGDTLCPILQIESDHSEWPKDKEQESDRKRDEKRMNESLVNLWY